jgi:hypothetical protein
MELFVWSTIILSVWGAVGPVVGIFIGHRLTRDWQKKQWILDNKKEEYRDVIHTLSSALTTLMQCNVRNSGDTNDVVVKAKVAAENLTLEVLGNRLFIADELERIGAYDKWVSLLNDLDKTRNDKAFAKGFSSLLTSIRQAALESIEIT